MFAKFYVGNQILKILIHYYKVDEIHFLSPDLQG